MNRQCIRCDKTMEDALDISDKDGETYPNTSEGIVFRSSGQFGSTVWDEFINPRYMQIILCDECAVKLAERIDIIDGKKYIKFADTRKESNEKA